MNIPTYPRLVRTLLSLVVLVFALYLVTTPAAAQGQPEADPIGEGVALVAEQTAYSLSSLPMLTSQAGWGPVELNSSIGEAAAGDGQTMSINGQTFSHGIGTHAVSVISFDLEGKCSQFQSWVGIDDEVGTAGAVIFKVFADGSLLFQSPMLTGNNGALNTGLLNISGVSELMLIVEDAGVFYSDHANWAEPIVMCNSQPGGNGSTFNHIRGSWGPVLPWPVKAIHASLLPSGHILSHASSDPGQIGSNSPTAPHNMTKVDLADINSWGHEWVDHPSEEMYCSAHTLLMDGSVFEFGGHGGADPNLLFYGQDQASRFDIQTKSWELIADMQQARWYPTAITLGNGDVMAIGGSHAGGNSFKPEIFNGNSWRMLNNVNYQNRLNNNEVIFDHTYPFVHLASDGRLFWAGWDEYMAYIDPAGNGAWSQNYFRESQQRAWGAPVMYQVDQLLLIGGIDHQGNYGLATNTVKHIDLSSGSPSTTDAAPMLFPRADVDGTILANGEVFVNGGGYEHILGSHPTHIYVPEIWNPATGQWTVGAAATNPRGYHSTTLLLPDGRVWTGGGECGDNCLKGKTAQVYTPPYLYNQNGSGQLAARPNLSYADSQAFYGQSFSANVSNGAVSKVTFIRLGSATHHINFEQRYLELSFQQSGSQITIQAPANGNLAPPGYYMLFVFSNAGVPSIAKMVQLVPSGTTPQPSPTPTQPPPLPGACGLLNNSGFENGLSGWAANGSLSLTNDAFRGDSAMSIQNGWAGQIAQGSGNETYTLSGQYKRIGSAGWISVGIDFLNSSGVEIGEAQTALSASGAYIDFSVTGTAPAGTAQIQVWLFNGGADTFVVDLVDLIPASCEAQPSPTPTPAPDPTATPQPPANGETIYVSSTSGGNISGISFRDEDILAYDTGSNSWSLFFDGSDVGLSASSGLDIDAFHIRADGTILLSIARSETVAGLGQVDDSDILLFTPSSIGPNTAGSFSLYFDGSDVLLTTNGEDIDGLSETPSGQLIISTIGGSNVGFGRADEDLLIFTPSSLGANTSGSWGTFFDGSDIGLNNSSDEDVYGVWVDGNDIYLTMRGGFTSQGISGQQADILRCSGAVTGTSAGCASAQLYWDGDLTGLGSERLDGIQIVR